MKKRNQKYYRMLLEKRVNLQNEMEAITDKAAEEKRAMTEEETTEFDRLDGEIRAVDSSIERIQAEREEEIGNGSGDPDAEERRATEENAFANYLRGVQTEQRADVNLTKTDNGAIIPTTIANRIIEEVIDICPIWSMSEHYTMGGTLAIPYYDESTQKIEMAYASEFADLESSAGKFASIELKGYLAGTLSLISRSLLNNQNFPLVDFTIQQIAKAAAIFIEKELLLGTADKIEGLSKMKQVVKAESATAITADDLIDLQEEVRDQFQANAVWIMNRKTRKAIRKFKNADGEYLLNRDLNAKWGYTLLGKPVYTSDAMPVIEAGKRPIIYGDMTGLAVKVVEDVQVDVLREKYATQHAVGVVAWLEIDAKVQQEQKLACLEMAAG